MTGDGGFVRFGIVSVDDSLDFDSGFLEVDEEAEGQAGGSEIVDALGCVLVGKAVCAFHFYQELVLDYDVGYVVSYGMAFVGDWKRFLGGGGDASEGEFFQEGSFIDLFEEAGAQGVGDFEDGVYDFLGEEFRDRHSVCWWVFGGKFSGDFGSGRGLTRMNGDGCDSSRS
jgi:hypothetical protein